MFSRAKFSILTQIQIRPYRKNKSYLVFLLYLRDEWVSTAPCTLAGEVSKLTAAVALGLM